MGKSYSHIAVRKETGNRMKDLKAKLENSYADINWDEVLNVLMEKNNRMTFNKVELDNIIKKSRGFKI